ncbi:unnamed protein product [Diamesa hyperborea]
MGKAQSKRSVDITTEPTKEVQEGSGKMEKIADVDQLKEQVLNSEPHINEAEATDKENKLDIDAAENEKDVTTEKEQTKESGDSAGVVVVTESTITDEANKIIGTENGDETLNDSKVTDEVAADSNKKPKKEKVKKKWSFRSISFSKKDKQKPSKKEKDNKDKDAAVAEETPAEQTNGECEKVPEETTEEVAAAPAPVASPENTTVETESPAKPEKLSFKLPVAIEAIVAPVAAAVVAEAEKIVETVSSAAAAIVENGKSVDDVPMPAAIEKSIIEVIKDEVKEVEEVVAAVVADIPAPAAIEEKIIDMVSKVIVEEAPIKKVEVNIEESVPALQQLEMPIISATTITTTQESDPMPPPLPSLPPPSQVLAFAESAMSAVLPQSDIPTISADDVNTQVVSDILNNAESLIEEKSAEIVEVVEQKVAAVVESVKEVIDDIVVPEIELPAAVEEVKEVIDEIVVPEIELPAAVEEVKESFEIDVVPVAQEIEKVLEEAVDRVESQISENIAEVSAAPSIIGQLIKDATDEIVAQAESLEEMVSDKVGQIADKIESLLPEESNDVLPPPPAIELDTEVLPPPADEELSVDISSPLPQNSLESLPSPPALESQIDETSASLPAPPPAEIEVEVEAPKEVEIEQPKEQAAIAQVVADSLNKTAEVFNEFTDKLENGNVENGHSEEAATNGNGTTNGHDSPTTESLNGDVEHEKVRIKLNKMCNELLNIILSFYFPFKIPEKVASIQPPTVGEVTAE